MAGLLEMLGLGGQQASPGAMTGTPPPQTGGLLNSLFGIDRSTPEGAARLQLLANSFTPGGATPRGTADGVSEAYTNAQNGIFNQQKMNMLQEDRATEQTNKNKTLELLRAKDPELAAAVEVGALTPNQGYMEILKKSQPQKGEWINVGDGTLFNTLSEEYRQAPAGRGKTKFVDGMWVNEETQTVTPAIGVPPDPKVVQDSLKTNLEFRKTYRAEDNVKTYNDIRNAYERLRSGAQRQDAQGDLGLVYAYMKLLDPGSVVREGEFATAENTGGIEDSVINLYNKALSGERLNNEQRSKFVAAGEDIYRNTAKNLEGTNSQYSNSAAQFGLDPKDILVSPQTYEPLTLNQEKTVRVGDQSIKIKKVSD